MPNPVIEIGLSADEHLLLANAVANLKRDFGAEIEMRHVLAIGESNGRLRLNLQILLEIPSAESASSAVNQDVKFPADGKNTQ